MIQKSIKNSLLICLLFSSIFSFAAHVVGGDISVTWISQNNYEIKLRMYRDCIGTGADFPASFEVGFYDFNHNLQFSQTLSDSTIHREIPLGDNCYIPTGICIDEGIYTRTVNIPDLAGGYYLSSQVYARNGLITNIANPGSTGITFYAEIPDPAMGQNSLPDFDNYPSDAYLCLNNPKTFQFNITDADGDSLAYSFTDPLDAAATGISAGPYNSCNWATGFSLADICGGTPPMTINNTTGEITASPTNTGIYAFVVKVEEFRNGVKIGETRRDIQYNAVACTFDAPPNSSANEADSIFYAPINERFCYDVILRDSDPGDTLYLSATSDIFNLGASTVTPPLASANPNLYEYSNLADTVQIPANIQDPNSTSIFNIGSIGHRICWTPTCEHLSASPYTVNYQGYSLGCSGRSENNFSYEISLRPPVKIPTLIPNVFTPNNDGHNDSFVITGYTNPCTDELTVHIYDRWGVEQYRSSIVEFAWDGRSSAGQECKAGTYYLIIKGVHGEKEIEIENKSITLIR